MADRALFATRRLTALPVHVGTIEPAVVNTRRIVAADPDPGVARIRLPLLRVAESQDVEQPFRRSALLLRPELLDAVLALQPRAPGERESFDIPICPQADVTDTVLFEDAKSPDVRFYLPRYALRRDGAREIIRMTKSEAGWKLVLELSPFVAPELGDVGAAGPLAHRVGVVLHYRVGDGEFSREFAVSQTAEGSTRAELALADDGERNVIYAALTEERLGTRLVVRRFVSVAVPAEDVSEPPPSRFPTAEAGPPLRFVTSDFALRRSLAPRIEPPPRDVVELVAPTFELRPHIRLPQLPAPGTPRYRRVDTSVDHDERPAFFFPRELYEYVFSEVEGGTGNVAFVATNVAFDGRLHRYYRDPMDRRVFHYLPDVFKLARQSAAPHAPALPIRFVPGAGGLDDMRVELSYFAVPHVEPARLESAARELPALLAAAGDPLAPETVPAFRALSTAREQVKLRLALPGDAPGDDVRESAQIELSTVIRESVSLALAEFRVLWESLFSAAPVLFQGSVEVALSDGVEQIPFVGRMDDLEGPTFDTSERVLPGGEIDVTLTNACESPLTLRGPAAFVVGPDGPVACTITAGADPGSALALAPGASAELRLVPVTPVASILDTAVRFASVEVLPDKEALYVAILDRSAPLDFLRAITVRGKHLFAAAPADDPLVAVLVEFERGTPAELTPEQPDGTGTVGLPLRDFVLGRMSSADIANAAYRYRMTLVHAVSGQQRSADWVESTIDILYPLMAPVAAPAPADPAGAIPAAPGPA